MKKTEEEKRVERVRVMEKLLDTAMAAVNAPESDPARLEAIAPAVHQLTEYYESGVWMRDFEDDRAGKFPAGLKRGVLSEDGIWDLLTDYAERCREAGIPLPEQDAETD